MGGMHFELRRAIILNNYWSENMLKERLLSVDDICEYLGVSRDTIYKWIEAKGLPAYRLGRLWKFKKEEVDGWLKKGSC